MGEAAWASAWGEFCCCVHLDFVISIVLDRFAHVNEFHAVSVALAFHTQFLTQVIAFWFPESWLMFTHDFLLGMETIKCSSNGCLLRPAAESFRNLDVLWLSVDTSDCLRLHPSMPAMNLLPFTALSFYSHTAECCLCALIFLLFRWPELSRLELLKRLP